MYYVINHNKEGAVGTLSRPRVLLAVIVVSLCFIAGILLMTSSMAIAVSEDDSQAVETVDQRSASVPPIELSAEQAVLVDYSSGQVLFRKNADQQVAPSSMTKMLTMYLVFQHLKDGKLGMTDLVPVSQAAYEAEGSRMFLELGKEVCVDDLLRGVIISSANDGSIALAEAVSGDHTVFAQQMQRTGEELGLHHSSFKNATGLPDPDHFSSVSDMALIAIALIRDFPEYYSYHAEREFTYNNIKQYNRNKLIGKGGVDGIKTGHTEAGGYGLAASADRGGWRLVSVVNGAASEQAREADTQKLLSYGFNFFQPKVIYKAGDNIATVRVWYGDKDQAAVGIQQDVVVVLEKIKSKSNSVKVTASYRDNIMAPLNKGDIIGYLEIEGDYIDSKARKIPLEALEDITAGSWYRTMSENIRYFWSKCISTITQRK